LALGAKTNAPIVPQDRIGAFAGPLFSDGDVSGYLAAFRFGSKNP
jgi:hypothetical protein